MHAFLYSLAAFVGAFCGIVFWISYAWCFAKGYRWEWQARRRFVCAMILVPTYVLRLVLAPDAFYFWMSLSSVVIWTIFALTSYLAWRPAHVIRLELAPAPPPQSPAARLDEIRGERAKLDAEERELLKRPDAHRP